MGDTHGAEHQSAKPRIAGEQARRRDGTFHKDRRDDMATTELMDQCNATIPGVEIFPSDESRVS